MRQPVMAKNEALATCTLFLLSTIAADSRNDSIAHTCFATAACSWQPLVIDSLIVQTCPRTISGLPNQRQSQ